jgi:hypothetical protein
MMHLISDYITIIRIISVLFTLWVLYAFYQYGYVFFVSMEATDYSHKLPVCGWGAHLGYRVTDSCSRRIDDEILALPGKDTDLLLLRSAHWHPVSREYFVLQ